MRRPSLEMERLVALGRLLTLVALSGEQPLYPLAQQQVRLRPVWWHPRRSVNDTGAGHHLALHELPAAQVENLAVLEPVPVMHPEALRPDEHVTLEEIAPEQVLHD